MRLLLLLSCVALVACRSRSATEEPGALLSQARQRLGERDAKLAHYRLEGTQREGDSAQASFTFTYRAPQRMLGTVTAPMSRTVAWDGTHLFEKLDEPKQFTTFANELPPEKLSGFLTEVFAPFVPEGFRAPLLLRSVTAKRVTHARARDAVELSMKLEGAEAEGLEVAYVLRWPTLDFLAKRTHAPDGGTSEVRVEDEHCDAALQLCVPRRLTRWVDGKQVGETSLSRVDLQAALPNDTFTLVAPAGYTAQSRTLVESGAASSDGG
ncbi:hypothetical protein DRW03_25160 [Corallococcus sp. H22C18031201]|nr:hypothetical protein DRW03_25160 [Corallococcus sp. H22C18031201]